MEDKKYYKVWDGDVTNTSKSLMNKELNILKKSFYFIRWVLLSMALVFTMTTQVLAVDLIQNADLSAEADRLHTLNMSMLIKNKKLEV